MGNEFKAWAIGSGANVETSTDYASDPALSLGLQSGIVPGPRLNKILRQGTVFSAMLAQFIADTTGQNVADDGNLAALEQQFQQALVQYVGAPAPASLVHGGPDNGSANNLQVTVAPVIVALRPYMLLITLPAVTSIAASATSQAMVTTLGGSAPLSANLLRFDGSPLLAGDIQQGYPTFFICDGQNWRLPLSQIGPRSFWGPADTGTADAAQIITTVPFAAFFDGQAIDFIKGALANKTAAPTLSANGIATAPVITRADGAAVQPGDLPGGDLIRTVYVNASKTLRLSAPISPTQVRTKLSGNLQLYVLANGSDSNTGLANTPAGAFKTIQGCWNAIFGLYDPAGFTIQINVGVGAGATFAPIFFSGYAGSVILAGDPNNPASTVINCGGVNASPVAAVGLTLTIQNLALQFDYTGTESPIDATIDIVTSSVTLAGSVTLRCSINRPNLYEIFVAGAGAQITFGDNSTIIADGTGTRNCFTSTSGGATLQVGQAVGNVTFKSTLTIPYNTFTLASKNSSQDWTAGSYGQFTATGVEARATFNSAIVLGGKTLPGNNAPVSDPTTYGVVK